jgi:hypothetical protein
MSLDITKYEFPEVSDFEMVFSRTNVTPELLAEAKERGFYNGNTKWNRLFHKMFHGKRGDVGVCIEKTRANKKALRYCHALMLSFASKHEEKEAVCALIMSENLIIVRE